MQLQISASGTPLTDSAKVYVTEKIGRLTKLLVPNENQAAQADVHLIYAPHNTKDTKDKCHVTITGIGQKMHVEATEPEMHVAIDAAAQKLEEQLRRHKDKRRDRITREATEHKETPAEDFMETDPVDVDSAEISPRPKSPNDGKK